MTKAQRDIRKKLWFLNYANEICPISLRLSDTSEYAGRDFISGKRLKSNMEIKGRGVTIGLKSQGKF